MLVYLKLFGFIKEGLDEVHTGHIPK